MSLNEVLLVKFDNQKENWINENIKYFNPKIRYYYFLLILEAKLK
jgi:hypothetical protein